MINFLNQIPLKTPKIGEKRYKRGKVSPFISFRLKIRIQKKQKGFLDRR